jgi:hypothetical protein
MADALARKAAPGLLRGSARSLKRLLADAARRPGFALARMPLMSEMIASLAPTLRPPILVVSLPRSGSSWVGHILGGSEDALYLREPITQSYLRRAGKRDVPVVFEMGACRDERAYELFAARAFAGILRFDRDIVQFPRQWDLAGRTRKRTVVKEVNPLAIERLWERFQPRIVFLVRHPVPVMRSFHALGWNRCDFWDQFVPATLSDLERKGTIPRNANFFEQSGAFQAAVQNRAIAFLANVEHAFVRYEDMCADPLKEFARIFDFCGLPFSAAVRAEIARSSEGSAGYTPGRYDTVRKSSDMKDRWKREVEPEQIELVRRGYFAMQPHFYSGDDDW